MTLNKPLQWRNNFGFITTSNCIVRIPETAKKKSAVILLHGAAGWKNSGTGQYAEYLYKRGFVTLEINLFPERLIGKVNLVQHVGAAFAALAFLSELDSVDENNISVFGQSYGGMVSLICATRWAKSKFNKTNTTEFKSHISFYPVLWMCNQVMSKIDLADQASILPAPNTLFDTWTGNNTAIFYGLSDSYDPTGTAVRKFSRSIHKNQRENTAFYFYDATHAWDCPSSVRWTQAANCGLGGNNITIYDSNVTKKAKNDLYWYLLKMQMA